MKPLNTSHSQCYLIQFWKFQSALHSLVHSSSNSGGNISICVSGLHYIVISLYHWFLFLCMCASLSFPCLFFSFSCFSPFCVSLSFSKHMYFHSNSSQLSLCWSPWIEALILVKTSISLLVANGAKPTLWRTQKITTTGSVSAPISCWDSSKVRIQI